MKGFKAKTFLENMSITFLPNGFSERVVDLE